MIIRKPYAFLIKNFKKIHIFLLILSFYIAYRLYDISKFVSEFMKYGTYDLYKDPITGHITSLMTLSIILLIVGSGALIILLMHKKKPWKIYLIPFLEYLSLFLVLNIIKGFFISFNDNVEVTDLRFARDMLIFFMIAQLPAIGVYIMRTFGLDIKKFNFNSDQEFLELSEEDREEVEISLNVDFNTFKRLYRRLLRNLNYFYIEHKLICKIAIAIVVVLLVKNAYTFIFVENRVYKAGQLYNANGYSIKVGSAYYTDKDYKAEVISKKSNFVVVEMYVKNNYAPRKLKMDNFHLRNRGEDYVSTHTTYSDEFFDLGTTYESVKEMSRGEELKFIIVYRVNKNLPKNGFVMYYQELGGNSKLRKIKINVKDIRNNSKLKNLKIGEDFDINLNGVEDTISIDKMEILSTVPYRRSNCTTTGCEFEDKEYTSTDGYKVIKLDFASLMYESKDMRKLLKKYGKINYVDINGEKKDYEIKFAIDYDYYGKYVYLSVPVAVVDSNDIDLMLTLRNSSFRYNLN